MSDVKSFVSTSMKEAPRGAKYHAVTTPSASSRARWPAGSPPLLQDFPNIQPAMPSKASFEDQIRVVLKNHYRFIGQTPRRSLVDQQVKTLCGHYKDLKRLGFDILDVTTFGLKHAKALLAKWQAGNYGSNTMYCRWSTLRSWSRALGKHGMLPSLGDLVPGFTRYETAPTRGFRLLTPSQIRERSEFLGTKPDLTVYLVDRLCREMTATREEALQLDIDAVLEVVDGDATHLRTGVGNQRVLIPHARLHLPLLTEARDFMRQRNRQTLAWSNLDLDGSLQKYSLRLSYVTRTLFPDANSSSKPSCSSTGEADRQGGAT